MNELDAHFECVRLIASGEVNDSNGCQLLCDHLRAPFVFLEEPQIENWVSNLSRSLATKCWGNRDFKSSCEKHGDHLFYIAESGDLPEIINVGYPMMEIPHSFRKIGNLTEHSTILLPQLIANISDASENEDPYFECIDLFRCHLDDFGLTIPEIDDIENKDSSRLLVDSIAILSMIKSWRELDPQSAAEVYFCTSSGAYAFGKPICIQKIVR